MNYWLMKSEPDVFGIDHLMKMPKKTEHWDGVRNYQARNMMRDEMKKGDLVFFYHSNCDEPGIVGIMTVAREGYPDHTAFDPGQKYHDPKSDPENPRWMMVDLRYRRQNKAGDDRISRRLRDVRPHMLSPFNNLVEWWIPASERKYRSPAWE